MTGHMIWVTWYTSIQVVWRMVVGRRACVCCPVGVWPSSALVWQGARCFRDPVNPNKEVSVNTPAIQHVAVDGRGGSVAFLAVFWPSSALVWRSGGREVSLWSRPPTSKVAGLVCLVT
jgi:hypothetical protein